MKIINARQFNEINDWFKDDTVEDMNEYQEDRDNNFEVYDADANMEELPILEIDEADESAGGYLADDHVSTREPVSVIDDSLQEVVDFRRRQEGLPEESILDGEPEIQTREEAEVDEVDESVAEATEIDERVKDFDTTEQAIQAAIDEHRVMEIFYVTRGRGNRDESKYLKRERGLTREKGGGVRIHRIVEPHYMYTSEGTGNLIVVTYDRSIGRGFMGYRNVDSHIRAYIVSEIYEYNFTKNRKTKKDQYFKPKINFRKSSGKGIQTMKNITDKLVKVASTLDKKGLKASSSVVKNAIKVATNYKKAQYVGVQGYWLRNRRCWDNCYRHKRTAQPGTPAQEVWMECWDEYKESINNSKSTWGKYAGTDDSLKTGSKKVREWEGIFAKKVKSKMAKGLNRPESIYSVIEFESQAHMAKIIQASSDLMILADTLAKNGHEKIGREMAAVSMGMLKEAQFQGEQQGMVGRGIQKVKDWWGGKGGAADVKKKIQDVIGRANQLGDMLDNLGRQMQKPPAQQAPQQAQASKATGFIIEAGKGTRIVEAGPKEGTPWWKDKGFEDSDAAKETSAPQQQGQQGDKDGDTVPDSEDKDDTPADNQPDAPQPEDAPQETTQPEGDKDGDTVPDSEDKDDTPPDNKPDAPQAEDAPAKPQQPQQRRMPNLNPQYQSLVKDISGLAQEFSALQQNKDPQVAQYTSAAVPVLQKFLGTSAQLRGMPEGIERVNSLRGTLQQLAADMQSVLAGQPVGQADMFPGGQQPGVQPGAGVGIQPGAGAGAGAGPGGMPVGDAEQQATALKGVIESVRGQDVSGAFAKSFISGKGQQPQVEWIAQKFEEAGVPNSKANWDAFRAQLAQPKPQPVPGQVAAMAIGRKRK